METYGVKYIGSKREINRFIFDKIKSLGIKTAIDVFSGTTRVAQYLKQNQIKTDTSDLSWATECYANTFIHGGKNKYLQKYIDHMNALDGHYGWISENYSGNDDNKDGRCFQLKNTKKADSARDFIDTLDIKKWEKDTLITSVIFALDKVDNTVGVQQAYLKDWCKRSYNDIQFLLPPNLSGPKGRHYIGNCLELNYKSYDLAYLDPPYSSHSYATYYHIWDSIAKWDKPNTDLKSKRRVDRVKKSDSYTPDFESSWNKKATVSFAFDQLISRLDCPFILVSYNNESLLDINVLIDICFSYGPTEISTIEYSRNVMSQIGNAEKNNPDKNQKNNEYLILIQKG